MTFGRGNEAHGHPGVPRSRPPGFYATTGTTIDGPRIILPSRTISGLETICINRFRLRPIILEFIVFNFVLWIRS